MKVTVFGSGNGGCASAFDFAQHGHEVSLIDFEQFKNNLSQISEAGGIRCEGMLEGFASVAYVGTDIQRGIEAADLIVIVGPAYSTEKIAKACKPYLRDGQKILISPGSCAGSIVFKKNIGRKITDSDILIAEFSTLPYATRILEDGVVYVYLKLKGGYYMSALPASFNREFYSAIQDVYPNVLFAENVLQTSLQNANPVIHPSVTLLNASLIERSGGDFLFYEEGVTEASGRLIEALDKERMEIGKAIGVKVVPDPTLGILQGYMLEDNYVTGYSLAPGFKGIMAQSRLDNRYITEDVAYGLIFLTDLASLAGVKTPGMDAVIQVASIIMGRDFKSEGARTLEVLGLNDCSIEEIISLIQ